MSTLQNIKKRDGTIAPFDQEKITQAIWKAAQSVGGTDQALAQKISNQVLSVLEVFFKNGENIPTVEQIQDLVEKILIEDGHAKTAKAYILYRQKQTELRQKKEHVLGRPATTEFSLTALKLLKQHFLVRAEDGTTIETPEEMMRRVAKSVALADNHYKDFDPKNSEQQFYQMLLNLDFLPQSAILANAGTSHQQLMSYYELNVEDSMESIFEEIKHAILAYQSGAKVIIHLSQLRPKGTSVTSTKGPACGPVAFLKIFDSAVSAIKQASKQGSMTAILSIDHPDILEFVSCKDEGKKLDQLQVQVAITQAFMEALLEQKEYELINPQTKKVVNKLDAKNVFDSLMAKIWHTEELGLMFVNKERTLRALEQSITGAKKAEEKNQSKYQIFTHGSINIANFLENGEFHWEKFQQVIQVAIHFLDNIFDISNYPSTILTKKAAEERKIGLGISGFAELLQSLNLPYNSVKALELAETISSFLSKEAQRASLLLAKKRGSNTLETNMRNKNLTAIMPDVLVHLIAEKTPGIDQSNPKKSDPESSIRVQAAFQKNIDGTVESTILFPEEAGSEELKKIALLCYQSGCHNLHITKSRVMASSSKNSDEQIELPFHRIIAETAQRKAKRQAQKNDVDRPQRAITPQKAEEVLLPPIIVNA